MTALLMLGLLFQSADSLIHPPSSAKEIESNASASPAGDGISVQFEPSDWPNYGYVYSQPQDWRGFSALKLTLQNPGDEGVQFYVRFDDDPSADGVVHCKTVSASIGPHATKVFSAPLGLDPMAFGMRAGPASAYGGGEAMGGGGSVDLGHIVRWQMFLHSPPSERKLVIQEADFMKSKGSFDGIVDEFGQYTGADWPGKMHSEQEISEAGSVLTPKPDRSDEDTYGGWAKGPRVKASGRFRAEKIGGKWWLVTPEGHLFLSFGADCVNFGDETVIGGRESIFKNLPSRDSRLAQFYGKAWQIYMGPQKGQQPLTFNFGQANLFRKYGQDWRSVDIDQSFNRLELWGFNTIGNWSDEAFRDAKRMPYVASLGVSGDKATVASGNDYWGAMHDVFDPGFENLVRQQLAPGAKYKSDPWCLGWFVDNELSWAGAGEENGRFGLAYGALKAGPNSPAKLEFLRQLKARYGDIDQLNQAWGTKLKSWEELKAPFQFSGQPFEGRREDLHLFVLSFCRRYFEVVSRAVHEIDPAALYLGCRFAWYGPEAEQAASEYCDVISYNIYDKGISEGRAAAVAKLGKPAIIGEFHFGALDRGMFHPGLVGAANQEERGKMYLAYVESVAENPNFVGCHWFQYRDEPVAGRFFDGENYNIGLVSVADVPYAELVRAAERAHAEAYRLRYGR